MLRQLCATTVSYICIRNTMRIDQGISREAVVANLNKHRGRPVSSETNHVRFETRFSPVSAAADTGARCSNHARCDGLDRWLDSSERVENIDHYSSSVAMVNVCRIQSSPARTWKTCSSSFCFNHATATQTWCVNTHAPLDCLLRPSLALLALQGHHNVSRATMISMLIQINPLQHDWRLERQSVRSYLQLARIQHVHHNTQGKQTCPEATNLQRAWPGQSK